VSKHRLVPDIALAALPEGAVVERKTPTDLTSCIGAGRERFERELRRGRYVGRLIVVIEGTWLTFLAEGLEGSARMPSLEALRRGP
jgi:hypothetical protein